MCVSAKQLKVLLMNTSNGIGWSPGISRNHHGNLRIERDELDGSMTFDDANEGTITILCLSS